MPEAAVHEYSNPGSREDNVRCPGKIPPVKPETQSAGVESRSQKNFRLGVRPPDAAHIEPTLFGRQDIH